jgi:hypothetical protein
MEEREASRRRFPAELSGGRRVSGEACQRRRGILTARSRPPPAGRSRRRTRARPAAGGAPGARSKAGRSRPVGEPPRRAPARRRPAGRLRLPRPRSSPAPHTRGRQVPKRGFPKRGFPKRGFPKRGFPKRGFPKGCPPKSHPQIRRGCRRVPVGCRRAAASQARGRGRSRESRRSHKQALPQAGAPTSRRSASRLSARGAPPQAATRKSTSSHKQLLAKARPRKSTSSVACGSGASHVVKYGAAAKTCLTRCCNLLSQCCTTAQIPVLPCLRPRSPFSIHPCSRSGVGSGNCVVIVEAPGPSLRRRSALDLIGRPPSRPPGLPVLALVSLRPDRPDRERSDGGGRLRSRADR